MFLIRDTFSVCLETHTAFSVLVEVGDFKCFSKVEKLTSYLGFAPCEGSSGKKQNCIGITKAGNSHIRRLLIEAAQCYTRGQVGYKSKVQNSVIAFQVLLGRV